MYKNNLAIASPECLFLMESVWSMQYTYISELKVNPYIFFQVIPIIIMFRILF